IGYVEAHGTATPLGDPIEIAALTHAYRAGTEQVGYCAIGSVKSNIGHLDAAAGVTGLIKATLALKHGELPPSLHFETPNPKLDLENSPFFVNTQLREWKTGATPRRAGVSSFGMGGTNAHVVLEEAPVVELSSPSREQQLLVLSAKSASALDVATTNLAAHLKENGEQSLADIAFTLQTGRRTLKHRRVVVVRDHADAVQALESLDPARVVTHQQEEQARSVVFLFPGQGAQYVNMGLELYEKEPVFQEQVDLCAELLKPHLGIDLREVLFPQAEQTEAAKQRLAQTMYTQPAIFVIEYALATLWQAWGVTPAAMIGHSIGEYVAATVAGVLSLEDALALVAARGKLMQELPGGSMLAIPLPEAEVTPLLGTELSLAAVNGPSACVVSGTNEAVDALVEKLVAQGTVHHRLDTSHAFHSDMMEPILAQFTDVVRGIQLNEPTVPYLSNVTGAWITANDATDPSYYAKHLRQTVRFAEGVGELLKESGRLLLEVGPGRVLGTLAGQQISADAENAAVALYSLRHRDEQQSDLAFLLTTLGKLWMHGLQVDWTALFAGETRQKVALPTYPFERKYYWVEAGQGVAVKHQAQGKKADLADWFYIPVWKRSLPVELLESLEANEKAALVFLDTLGFGAQLAKRLEQAGQEVVTVAAGDGFAKLVERAFAINPQSRQEYSSLFEALAEAGSVPKQIFHLWGLTASETKLDEYEKMQNLSFYSLFNLAQALGEQNMRDNYRIAVVTNQLQDVIGEEVLAPERATMLGAVQVISQEFANISVRSIDVELPQAGSRGEELLLGSLAAELVADSADTFVAYRRNHRLVRTFDAAKLNATTDSKRTTIREGGTYLITGATAPNGLAIADHLAQSKQAKLVLIAHADFPAKDAWQNHLDKHSADDVISQQINRLRAIEALGHGVLFISANVTDLTQMQHAIDQAHAAFGDIHGVFHTAEVKGSGLMQLKSQDMVAGVLDPKVKGTLTLEAALQSAELDFFVLFSATNAILGGLGQVDSSAAHAFLD
ncbi:MAG: type I polyketide synthase, partial [Tumebacillaceae bacterium]